MARGLFGGGSQGASKGTDVSRVAFSDAEGNHRTLAEFRGKVVLVDVWATWCPPCRKSLPEVAELQKSGGDRYVVLPISVDRGGWSDVKPFLAQNPQLGLTAYVPDGAGPWLPSVKSAAFQRRSSSTGRAGWCSAGLDMAKAWPSGPWRMRSRRHESTSWTRSPMVFLGGTCPVSG
jgi:thiol-disulfide isomerase/thioredoxin